MHVAAAEHARPPSMFVTEDGSCMQCGRSVAVHKVVWVAPEEIPDFAAMGLTDCMFETGADTHHGLWCRYLCLILEDDADTMERDEFEDLYR